MRKIFAIIFILTAIGALLSGAEPEFSGEVDAAVAEALRGEARTLATIFHSPWNRSGVRLTVVFSPAAPAGAAEVQNSAAGYVLVLCGTPSERQRDFAFRRKLFSTFLAAAAGAAPATGDRAMLPPWLAAALEHRLTARRYEERLLAGNRRTPVLYALVERGKTPSAETVRHTDPKNFDPGARAWMEELSRVLLSLGGRRIASTAYLRRCAGNAARGLPATAADDAFLVGEPETFQRNFAVELQRVAWHTLSPRPARWAIRKFDEVRKVRLPVLDEAGKPIPGKFEACDLSEIGDKLKGRPDAAKIAGDLKKRVFDFAAGDSRRVKSAIFNLAELVGMAAQPPFRYRAKLDRAIADVISEMRYREKTDAYMRKADLDRAPARRVFRRRLECVDFCDGGSSLLSAEGSAWLDRRERDFL